MLQNRIQSQFLGEASNRGDIIKQLLNTYTDQVDYLVHQISEENKIVQFLLLNNVYPLGNNGIGIDRYNYLNGVNTINNSRVDGFSISSLLYHRIEDYNNLFSNSANIKKIQIFDNSGLILLSSDSNAMGKSIFGETIVPQNFNNINKNTIVSLGSKMVSNTESNNHITTTTTIGFVTPLLLKDQKNNSKKFYILTIIDTNSFNNILTNRKGLGQSGETYLVNSSSVMVSQSRFISNNEPIKVETLPVRECFYNSGKNANGFYNDYRGIPIVGFSYCAKDMDYVLLSEIDQSEIYHPVIELRDKIIEIASSGGFILFVISVLVIYLFIKWNKNLKNAVSQSTSKLEEANSYLKRAYEQLKKKDQLQQEFINVAAHELRTPTQALTGYIDLLQEVINMSEPNKLICISKIYPYIKTLERNSNRLLKLVTDIIDVTKIESGNLQLSKEKTNLYESLEITIKEILIDNSEAKEKDLKFVLNGNAVNEDIRCYSSSINDQLFASVDKTRVNQVLSYLINNAIKFSRNKGTITVITSKIINNFSDKEHENINNKIDESQYKRGDPVSIIITITNEGKSLDPNIQERLFEKFTTSSEKGLGMGLFISKKIIEAHGGKIWINSDLGNNLENKNNTLNKKIALCNYQDFKSNNINDKTNNELWVKGMDEIYYKTTVYFTLPIN